jgi:hypothetical protein
MSKVYNSLSTELNKKLDVVSNIRIAFVQQRKQANNLLNLFLYGDFQMTLCLKVRN